MGETFSNCASAEIHQPIDIMITEKGDTKSIWDIGFNIGSNFLMNSFLCPSKDKFCSSMNSGLPKKNDSDDLALVPIGSSDTQKVKWTSEVLAWKDRLNKIVSERLQNKSEKEFEDTDSSVLFIKRKPNGRSFKKKIKYSRRKRKNLSVREDVMNKNILRALKRELISMFDMFHGSKKIIGFKEKVKEFCDDLILTSSYDAHKNGKFNTQDFYTYVGIFVNYCKMKKLVRTEEEREKLKLCYDVVYSYSHHRFNKFIATPEITALIQLIISAVGIDKVIEDNETLKSTNEEKYKEHIVNLLEKL